MRWPTGIALGFVLLVLVNAAFVALAVGGADPVVDSYWTEAR